MGRLSGGRPRTRDVATMGLQSHETSPLRYVQQRQPEEHQRETKNTLNGQGPPHAPVVIQRICNDILAQVDGVAGGKSCEGEVFLIASSQPDVLVTARTCLPA